VGNATSVLLGSFSAQNASFVCLVKTWCIHQAFTKFSPGFGINRVFTRFCKFTRFSPRFENNHHVHQVFGNSPRLLPVFENSQGFGNATGFHQVLEIHQVFTKCSPVFQIFHQAWAINQEVSESHQVFTAVIVGM